MTLKVSGYSGKVTWSTSDKTVAAVSTKGVVKAVNLGSAKITAKAGKQTLTCKIKVVDVNTNASVSLKVSDGGYFIKGVSKATAAFKPKANCAKAVATIYSSDGDKVYSKTFTSLKKNKAYSFSWSGKASSGKYVPAGKYQLKVKIGTTVSKSAFLKFEAKNLFAGGNGSKTNPFLIEKTSQFNNVGKYPNAYFKQMNNLDFGYKSAGGFFNQNNPFNGVYDGNKKIIKNVATKNALFRYVGKKGNIKNVVMEDCTVIFEGTVFNGLLSGQNEGNISNCKVDGEVFGDGFESGAGIISGINYGMITECTVNGIVTITAQGYEAFKYNYAGGITGVNASSGKIVSCISNADVNNLTDAWHNYPVAGGIAGDNGGTIKNCESSGRVESAHRVGGIAGMSATSVSTCTYNGPSDISLVG